MKLEVHPLPDGYDLSSDNGRRVVEMFLDSENPSHSIHIERHGDDFVAVAEWEESDARRSR